MGKKVKCSKCCPKENCGTSAAYFGSFAPAGQKGFASKKAAFHQAIEDRDDVFKLLQPPQIMLKIRRLGSGCPLTASGSLACFGLVWQTISGKRTRRGANVINAVADTQTAGARRVAAGFAAISLLQVGR